MADAGVFKSILLLVDGSEAHRHAVDKAVELAVANGAELHAAAVIDTDTLKQLLSSRIFVADEMEEYEKDLEVSGRHQLDYVTRLAKDEGISVDEILSKGAIHSAILSQQKSTGADLVVLAGFRSTARRDLLASEKQRIIDECPCTVMVVP